MQNVMFRLTWVQRKRGSQRMRAETPPIARPATHVVLLARHRSGAAVRAGADRSFAVTPVEIAMNICHFCQHMIARGKEETKTKQIGLT